MISIPEIIIRLDDLLMDAGQVRWPMDERLRWIQDALRTIAISKPDALAEIALLTLTAGTVQQPLPDGVLRLLEVRRNTLDQSIITATTLTEMDMWRPNWQRDAPKMKVRHFIVDARDPRVFFVWPRPATHAQVEVIWVRDPNLPQADNELNIDSSLLPVITDYVLYRAFSKDAEDAFNANRALAYRTSFFESLGLSAQSEAATLPLPGSA